MIIIKTMLIHFIIHPVMTSQNKMKERENDAADEPLKSFKSF